MTAILLGSHLECDRILSSICNAITTHKISVALQMRPEQTRHLKNIPLAPLKRGMAGRGIAGQARSSSCLNQGFTGFKD